MSGKVIGSLPAQIIDGAAGVNCTQTVEVAEWCGKDGVSTRFIRFTCGTATVYVKRQDLAVIMKDIFHGM